MKIFFILIIIIKNKFIFIYMTRKIIAKGLKHLSKSLRHKKFNSTFLPLTHRRLRLRIPHSIKYPYTTISPQHSKVHPL